LLLGDDVVLLVFLVRIKGLGSGRSTARPSERWN
jgi:hypothetical protein